MAEMKLMSTMLTVSKSSNRCTCRLVKELKSDKFVLSGGVAANKPLRALQNELDKIGVKFYYPSLSPILIMQQ